MVRWQWAGPDQVITLTDRCRSPEGGEAFGEREEVYQIEAGETELAGCPRRGAGLLAAWLPRIGGTPRERAFEQPRRVDEEEAAGTS